MPVQVSRFVISTANSLSPPPQVLLYLESEDKLMEPLHRPYMRVSAFATISNIKKYVVHKLIADSTLLNFHEVDILCNDEILGKDHTLKFINATRWCHKVGVLALFRLWLPGLRHSIVCSDQ